MRRWRNPYAGQAWAACQTCGQCYPASFVWLNPRWGWQCGYCWDGLISRDQIQQPIFPGEGTRRTPAPVVQSLTEGIAPGSLNQTYIYPIRDRATGQIWNAQFVPLHIGVAGDIVYDGPGSISLTLTVTPEIGPFDGIRINNNWTILVVNGALATQQVPLDKISILDGACDFGQIRALLLRDLTLTTTYYWVTFPASGPTTVDVAIPNPNQQFYTGVLAINAVVPSGMWIDNGIGNGGPFPPGIIAAPPPVGTLTVNPDGSTSYNP